MIILLQSVTAQFCSLFDLQTLYYKVRQSNSIKSVTGCYCKVGQISQSVTVITK